MDNLDEFLNSLGISEPSSISEETVESLTSFPTEPPTIQEEPQPLSNADFDDILEEYGFTTPQEAEAEEIHDGSDDEGVEEEERDLDAEEDADWQEAIYSCRSSSIEFDPASVADQEFHLYIPDGVVSVPIVTEDQNQELHESEQTAIEAHQAVVETSSQNEPIIPLNSPTLLMDDSTSRFSGTEWYEEIQKKRIILAGLGGIGSWTALQLARMKPRNLVLYDDDMVESANMSGQMYGPEYVGRYKANAIQNIIVNFCSNSYAYAVTQKFTADSEAGDIMICGFDSMTARRTFFDAWCNHLFGKTPEEKKQCLFIDGRLSINTLQVFVLTGDDDVNILRYQDNYLFSDTEADETVCSMKQTTYLACMIGSIITNLFVNWVANTLSPVIPYDLPFFTEYDAQNMIFKTEN